MYHTTFEIHYSPVGSGGRFLLQLAQEVRAGQTASSDIVFTANDKSLPPITRMLVDHLRTAPAEATGHENRGISERLTMVSDRS